MRDNQRNVEHSPLVLHSGERLGATVPDESQRGNVIVDGGLAHELLHAIDHGGAQFFGRLFAGLLQACFYPIEPKFLAPALAFEQPFGNQQKGGTRRQRDQGSLAGCVGKQPQG